MNNKEAIGEIGFLNSGNAYVKIDSENDIFIFKNNTLNALHMDTVKISIHIREGRIEGKVIEVTKRFKTQFVGTTQIYRNTIFVTPDNSKCPVDFLIPDKPTFEVKNNQKVIVEFKKWKPGAKSPYGTITKVLGDIGDNNAEMNSIMYEYNLPIEFPKDVEEEANKISSIITEEEISKRLDLRNVLTFTIDGETAKDLDDALSIEYLDNDLIRFGIHIADVTHYIKPGTLLDKEALNRSTSVYLVDRCIPMLPHKLSNDVCSLNPNTDKLVYSFIFTMDKDANIISEEFKRGIINSNFRLTYTEVQKVINGEDTHTEELKKALLTYNEYALKLNKIRNKDQSITITSSEVKFELDEKGKPIGVSNYTQNSAMKLIEEWMVLTNMRSCEFISKKGYTSIHRSHDRPDIDRLSSLKMFAENLGYKLDLSDDKKIKRSLNHLLEDVKGSPYDNIINNLVSRTMVKANYQTNNIGHYGLSLMFYGHTTSPIRRYADVLLHRHLTQILENNINMDKKLQNQCDHINKMENLASKAQRDSIKYKQCEYLQDKIGKIFPAIISGVTDFGIYAEIIENKCDGLIKLSSFKNVYTIDMKNYAIVSSSNKIKLGDNVMVKVISVNLDRKTIDLEVAF